MAASGVRTKDLCVQVGYQVGPQNCSRDLLTIPATPTTKPVDPACSNHHPSSSSSPHPVPRKLPQKLQGVPSSGNASDHPHKSSGSRPARKKSNPASAAQSLDPSSSQSSKKLSQDSPSKTSKVLLNGTENSSKAGNSISMKHTLGENSEEASPNSHGKSSSIEASMRSRPKHTKVIENNMGEHQISNNVVSVKQKTSENGLITKAELLDKVTQQQEIVVDPLPKSPDNVSTKEEQAQIDDVECSSVAGSNYETACGSVCGCDQLTETISIKETGVAVKVSDGTIGVEKRSGSGKVSGGNPEFGESGKSSIYRGSNSSDVSDESSCSSLSSSVNKPHKANDSRWESIQVVRSREGALGLNHFRLLKRLGCGDIGSVYLAELVGTKSYFAMKVMDKGALASRKKLLRAQTEREILQCLDHPFLPTLYTHFDTETFSCLVMEFCPGGDLHTLRQKQPGKYFPEHAARFYVAEVLLSLEYLHMLGIIYRDLKPENVLVREDGHIMLSDFDLSLRCAVSPTLVQSAHADADPSKRNSGYCVQPACIEPSCVIQPSCVQPSCFAPRFLRSKKDKEKKQIKPKHKSDVGNQVSPLPELIAEPTNARSMSFVGTHEYLAPEIIKGEGHGSAVDWWTFGIFLYELLFGKTPFKGSGNRATLFNVVGQPLRFPESPTVSFAARDLIRGLLVKEPQHRLAYRRGATEVKQHPFFQSVNWALIRCASPPDIPRSFDFDFPARPPAPPPAAPAPEMNNAGIDMKPSGNYLEIDFF